MRFSNLDIPEIPVRVFWIGMLAILLAACGSEGSNPGGGVDVCRHIDCGAGVCYEQAGEPFCLCDSGYVADGLSCVSDPCDPDPCVYGMCRGEFGRAVCDCDTGYSGDTCASCAVGYSPVDNVCVPGDPSADPCRSDPCVFGICSLSNERLVCTCHLGYAGARCEQCAEGFHVENLACVPDGACSPNPCLHGTCRVEGEGGTCDCAEGYTGDYCDTCAEGYVADGVSCVAAPPGSACDPNPCLAGNDPNRTQCADVGGEAVCGCDPGYVLDSEQDLCIESVDPCAENPCTGETDPHRVVCSALGQDYECLCESGWREGDGGMCVEDTSTIPTRELGVLIQYRSSSSGPVYVRGQFNGWGLSHPMTKTDGVWQIRISDLPAGDYAYKLYDESSGEWFLDPNNRYTMYASLSENFPNSRLIMPDFSKPELLLDAQPQADGQSVTFSVAAYMGRGRYPLEVSSAKVYRNGVLHEDAEYDPDSGVFTINDAGLSPNKYSYRFEIADSEGHAAETLFVPVWLEQIAFEWEDATLYFVMTDRFRDGDSSNNAPVSDSELDWKANWQGGDFAGIIDKIEDGYFAGLGVNALWISSPIMNTQGAFWGSDGHKYSGYHSYWPISTGWTNQTELPGVQPIDPHFGDLDEFKQLVQIAHDNGIRVIVDFVANHVHTDSPLYSTHLNDDKPWFHWSGGAGNGYVCGWEKPIECWFAEYLPDFEYKNLDVMKTVMDHAIWLVQETNVDGFRLDAVKHMILDFSSTLRARLDDEVDTVDDIRFYMVGETFTGDDGQSDIARYVSPELLDGQFDFPMFWRVLGILVRGGGSLYDLKNFMDANDGYYGAGAVMSTFLGNHDVPRALSYAAGQIWEHGDPKEQGWTSPPGVPDYATPFKRLRMAWTFLFTQVGIPLIYYADEYGMPGAGDPDNRRMMQFDNELNQLQKDTLAHVRKLGKARLVHASLRTGARRSLIIENDYWAYAMQGQSDAALVVLNRGASNSRDIDVSAVFANGVELRDIVSNRTASVSGGKLNVQLGELETAVWVEE